MNNIISTRIRFARNIKGKKFSGKMTEQEKRELLLQIKEAAKNVLENTDFIDMEQLNELRAGSLVEQHLISPEFVSDCKNSGLLLSRDNTVSIMINEEDHLRIQVIEKGYNIEKAYTKALGVEKALGSVLEFSYSDDFGYLTQCPSNLGTAMRASVMIHLPALTESGHINKLPSLLSQYRLTIRGLYGEGSRSAASIYQISNQASLGVTEEEIIERLEEVIKTVEESENNLRARLSGNITVQDRIFRSYGALCYARMMTSEEATRLIGDVRFGAEAEILDIDPAMLDKLMIEIQPYSVALTGTDNRDIKRAEMIRTAIKK